MIALLFNTTFWYDVLIVAAILIVVLLCLKFPNGKYFFGTIFSVVLVVSTAYCGIQLNYYYTASGGIFGYLSGLYSMGVEVEELEFSFSNMELTKTDEDLYSAILTTNNVMALTDDTAYCVYVNDLPCQNVESSVDYITAEYTYAFYDEDFNVLCTDTLYFRFAFYTNSTYLAVRTYGGSETVKYWNYYFNKNIFVVSVKATTYNKETSFITVKYVYTDDYIQVETAFAGSTLNLPNLVGIDYWTVNGEIVTDSMQVTEDIVVMAHFEEFDKDNPNYLVCSVANGGYLIASNSSSTIGFVYYDGGNYEVISLYGNNWNRAYSATVEDAGNILFYSTSSEFHDVLFAYKTRTLTILENYYSCWFYKTDTYLFGGYPYLAVFSSTGSTGLYLYDGETDTTYTLYSSYYWTSFSDAKFNENTGEYSTIRIYGSSDKYYLSYDFITGNLTVWELDDDLMVTP